MFDGLLPARHQDKGAQDDPAGNDGTDYRYYDGNEILNVGLQRGAGSAARPRVRGRAHVPRLRAGRLLTTCTSGYATCRSTASSAHMLPIVPPDLRPALRPARRGQGRGGSPWCGAHNDWQQHRPMVRRRARPVQPPVDPRHLGSRALLRPRPWRVAKKGCHAVTFSENPTAAGLALPAQRPLGPVLAACADEEMVVCMHLGSSSQDPHDLGGGTDRRHDQPPACHPTWCRRADLRGRPSCASTRISNSRSSPRVASAGSPMPSSASTTSTSTTLRGPGQDFGDQLPSQVLERPHHHLLHRRCVRRGAAAASSSTSTTSPGVRLPALSTRLAGPSSEALMKYLDGVTDEDINKITHLNAMKHFQFDPFKRAAAREVHCRRCGPRSPTSTRQLVSRSGARRTRVTPNGIVSVTNFYVALAATSVSSTLAAAAVLLTTRCQSHYPSPADVHRLRPRYSDHVVTITINRPEARNSMDMEHFFGLRSAWDCRGEERRRPRGDRHRRRERTSLSGWTSRPTS